MSPLAILTGASSGIGAAAAEQFIGPRVLGHQYFPSRLPRCRRRDPSDRFGRLGITQGHLRHIGSAPAGARQYCTRLFGTQRLINAQRPLRYHRGLSTDGGHLG